MTTDDELNFASEEPTPAPNGSTRSWKIMVVDDEPSVHEVTHLTLRDFTFEERPLEFIDAYSGAQARTLLQEHPDTALILLDVVMETEDAGLEVARYVRQELNNLRVRIVLRTGQPGQAPEEQVVRDYDINDYREKTELTRRKFFTTVYSALRSYRDIVTIDRNRRGLERIIDSSSSIFQMRSLDQFVSGLMTQVLSVLKLDDERPGHEASAFVATCHDANERNPHILTGSGDFSALGMSLLNDLPDPVAKQRAAEALKTDTTRYYDDACAFLFKNQSGRRGLIYVANSCTLDDTQRRLLDVFCSNICIAYSNVSLNDELEHTQQETLYMLGTIAEFRSSETAHHVVRVARYAALLAQKIGLPQDEVERIQLAAPLHDIGKIGVPDNILMKPGQLTDEEYVIMQGHAEIGHDMLRHSERPLLQAAARIAHEHQEKWDGSGYPRQLKGEDIHLYGRIVALADVFDALLSQRCYKTAWNMEQVLDYLREQRGRHFDPSLTDLVLQDPDAFAAIHEEYRDDMPD